MLFTIDTDRIKPKQPTDDLMRRVAGGDMDAFAELYELTKHTVYCFLLSVVRNRSMAEDLMQDTYLSVRKSIQHYIPKNKPMAWIFTIARNLAYMELRRRGSHPETNLDDLGETIPAKEELSGLIDRLVLQKTLQSLGDKERQIVLLHAVSGLKFREVADVVEMPLGSVLSGYSRAMKKLKKILNEEG